MDANETRAGLAGPARMAGGDRFSTTPSESREFCAPAQALEPSAWAVAFALARLDEPDKQAVWPDLAAAFDEPRGSLAWRVGAARRALEQGARR